MTGNRVNVLMRPQHTTHSAIVLGWVVMNFVPLERGQRVASRKHAVKISRWKYPNTFVTLLLAKWYHEMEKRRKTNNSLHDCHKTNGLENKAHVAKWGVYMGKQDSAAFDQTSSALEDLFPEVYRKERIYVISPWWLLNVNDGPKGNKKWAESYHGWWFIDALHLLLQYMKSNCCRKSKCNPSKVSCCDQRSKEQPVIPKRIQLV